MANGHKPKAYPIDSFNIGTYNKGVWLYINALWPVHSIHLIYVIIYIAECAHYFIVQIRRMSSMFTAAQMAQQVPATPVWDFGGTWSSELAGVRFVVHSHSTVGIDNSIPVKILDMEVGTKSNGFLNEDWLAKANAHYGPLGPVSLSIINIADKNVAMFIGNLRFAFSFSLKQIK